MVKLNNLQEYKGTNWPKTFRKSDKIDIVYFNLSKEIIKRNDI